MLSTYIRTQVNKLEQRLFLLHRKSRRLLPGECLICSQPVSHERDLCDACSSDLPHNTPCCDHCAEPLALQLPRNHTTHLLCSRCGKQSPAFDRVIAPWRYAAPVDQLLWGFKYQQQRTAGYLLLDLLLQALQYETLDQDALLVIPGQKQRIRERGLHAPAWLARRLALATGLNYQPNWLQRQRDLPSQQELGRKARWLNPRDAFTASPEVAGKRLLLLDDVVTTGATVHWASEALKAQGARGVTVIAMARTPT